ncbi:MAG: hypothetical protein SNH94_04375 [Rikenellaceae bacterium]
MRKKLYFSAAFLLLAGSVNSFAAKPEGYALAGADEKTPSRTQYFSWINNTNEGASEEQSLTNLSFFEWLHKDYGMILDIYAFDAGLIDGRLFYGQIGSDRFNKQFPNGLDSVYRKAQSIQTRLGVWGGPDGFGDTDQEAEVRKKQMVSLCEDYQWALFKFDAVCGPLRMEKEDHFIDLMQRARQYSPDLILLNHRLGLEKSLPYATTFLWGGQETYVDVHTSNTTTAPHNRAGVMERGLVPDLQRLTEDHGVCISSCVDFWDDDLVLQAFNRSLILAPEIYGNPWLLADSEFPKLARIYNLHKMWGEILVDGTTLPESYGDYAVARGDEATRIITLRNLSWDAKKVEISLDKEIGLEKRGRVSVRVYHPYERIYTNYKYGDKIELSIDPFRSLLVSVSTSDEYQEAGVEGVDFELVKSIDGAAKELKLLGMPGSRSSVKLAKGTKAKSVKIDGVSYPALAQGKSVEIEFGGEPLAEDYNRFLGKAKKIEVQDDAATLYEATAFAADNNALEVRSLERSGDSHIEQVKAARDAFFTQEAFVGRGCWDDFLFDGDTQTGFWPTRRYTKDHTIKGGCFRLDLGEVLEVDSIVYRVNNTYELQPILIDEGNYAYLSDDLKDWQRVTYIATLDSQIPVGRAIRYIKLPTFPDRINEVEVYSGGKKLSSEKFRASNLFADSGRMEPKAMWQSEFTLSQVTKGSYLSVALDGEHGVEGAYAALIVDGEYVGAPSRATSYQSNTWEYLNDTSSSNYTYYFPLKSEYAGKKIEVFVMGYSEKDLDFVPSVWYSSYSAPYSEKVMVIK